MVAAMRDLPEDEPAELEACSSENFDLRLVLNLLT